MKQRRKGFSLVELLVVIGIITLLIGILMPTLAKARESARRVACRSNLQQIGHLMQMYVNDYRGHLPHVETSPADPIAPGYPTMPRLLASIYLKDVMDAFRCPSDRITDPGELAQTPSGDETYFKRDGSSYAYDGFVFNCPLGGTLVWDDALQKAVHALSRLDKAHVPVFWDKESFHNWEKGSFFGGNSLSVNLTRPGAKNCLFADGHVGDMTR